MEEDRAGIECQHVELVVGWRRLHADDERRLFATSATGVLVMPTGVDVAARQGRP